ncbi:MAG: hypothetical protein HKN79_01995 [Flavobacteriales bacterium]|nr:hypothetical protein [Flavobacteriales bacterium]
MTRHILFLNLVWIITACGAQKKDALDSQMERPADEKLYDQEEELVELLIGSFSSAEQAASDTNYYDISLHMVPIWTDLPGHYLYVEQAVTAMPQRPYRQRVYHVHREGDLYYSDVYTLQHDSLFIGKWTEPDYFSDYDTSILTERIGCTVILKRLGDRHYRGSTRDRDCESSFQGASYATSEVEIEGDVITSWDRGFDMNDDHVWGATQGPYIFKRKE